jgi:hypothetical protein
MAPAYQRSVSLSALEMSSKPSIVNTAPGKSAGDNPDSDHGS